MINGRVSPDGALFVLQQAAPDGAPNKGGQAMTDAGVLYVGNVGPMGSVAIDPATIATRVWYDPSDISTMFLDSNGVTQAKPVGTVADQPIELLLDKSGRGAHQVQPDNAKAPILSARVNLLTKTEDFLDVVWSTPAQTPVPGYPDPFGTNRASKIATEIPGVTYRQCYQLGHTVPAVSITGRAFLKKEDLDWAILNYYDGTDRKTWFNIVDGTVGQTEPGTTAKIERWNDGWWLATVERVSAASTNAGLSIEMASADGDTITDLTVGQGTLVFAAQVLLTEDINLPYQRVNTDADYDAAGFPHYLIGNGTSTSMGSAATVDLTNTSEIAVFTGVEKQSDALALYAELSANFNNNLGSFYSASGEDAGQNGYSAGLNGTLAISAARSTGSPAVDRAVVTNQLGLDTAVNLIRRNGSVMAGDGTIAGGDFGNYPLFLFARNNLQFYWTGKIYQFILLDYMPDADLISGLEQYVNTKIGGTAYFSPNSYLTDQNGTVMVGPPPIVGYKGGYPYNADNELVVQLNQPPVPGDVFVGGIRVGPLGGVYVIDTTPPPPADAGFSDGYSDGYDAVP
jgi:hypothetical protein